MISIKGMDKACVLAALYNKAQVLGMGILQHRPGNMPVEAAQVIIEKCQAENPRPFSPPSFEFGGNHRGLYFDYLYGRVMKIDIGGDELDERLYDRDNGEGAALRALQDAGLFQDAAAA